MNVLHCQRLVGINGQRCGQRLTLIDGQLDHDVEGGQWILFWRGLCEVCKDWRHWWRIVAPDMAVKP